jgi:hypothetical protein
MPAWPASPPWAPRTFEQLTTLELLVLATKLRAGTRRARRAALRSRSPRQIWDMVRLSYSLAGLGDDVSQALARH